MTYNDIPARAKELLAAAGVQYIKRRWRIKIGSPGFALAPWEQQINDRGGRVIGRNWREALTALLDTHAFEGQNERDAKALIE